MKKISMMLILSLGLLFALSPAQLKQELDARYAGIESFQADVSQTNYYTQLGREISYAGKLYFTSGRMLMHFDKPAVQRLYISGGQAELFDGASKLLVQSKIKDELSQMNPVEILAHYWDKSELKVSTLSSGDFAVELIPEKDPNITQIKAEIAKNRKVIKKLEYKDKSGNRVEYVFSGIKLNQTIPAAVWNYTYPADTQRISR